MKNLAIVTFRALVVDLMALACLIIVSLTVITLEKSIVLLWFYVSLIMNTLVIMDPVYALI